jgi:DNA polymerase alpha subunit A
MDSLLGDLTSTTSTSFMSQSDMRKRKTTADSHYSRDSLRASTASSFRTKLSSSSDPASADDLFSLRRKNDPSSDGADLSWNNIDDSKRARTSGVEDRFEIMDFDASFDGGDAFMADAAALNGAAAADEMDIAVKKPAAPQTNGAARPRQLVNVTSVKARRPARMEDEEIQTEQKKPKGMDWRVATAAIAIADASSDPPPVAATELPSTEKKPRGKAAILIPQVNKSNIKAFEEDGSLRFYWLDYVENNGAVNLFGKVFDKETKKYVSCCVTVNGIERNLFILPRGSKTTAPKKAKAKPKKAATQMDLNEDAAEAVNSGSDWGNSDDEEEAPNSEDEGQESEYKPTMDDVEDDIDDVLRQAGVSQYRHKEVVRKYAFEVPGVPAETRWLKLKYGFDKPQLPLDLSGRTFSHVFGTNTSAFELFAIKRKIMGPCWLKVLNGEVSEKPVKERFSWCKLELSVTNPKHVNPFSDREADAPKDTPPLNIMSLTIRTVINTEQNKNEIACATARVWQGANLDDTTPIEKQICNLTTVVRPLGKNFPAGFEEAAKASKSTITPVRAERVLLNNLLATIQRYDPDIIVGHEFAGVTLDVLLHRMKELKVDFWSRIGRVQRGDRWPRLRNHLNSHILNGRLILDLASEGSKVCLVLCCPLKANWRTSK